MTAERLAEIREAARVALLTPGEAHREDLLEERQEAIKAAPALLKETLAYADEQRCLAEYATQRCADWYEYSLELGRRNNSLLHRALSADHLRPQNALLRELYLRERRKRQAQALLHQYTGGTNAQI